MSVSAPQRRLSCLLPALFPVPARSSNAVWHNGTCDSILRSQIPSPLLSQHHATYQTAALLCLAAASQTVKKVIEINPFLLGTMAGGAADCMFWQRNLGMQVWLHDSRHQTRCCFALNFEASCVKASCAGFLQESNTTAVPAV